MDDRDEKGHFKDGWKGGPGRPKKNASSNQVALLSVTLEVCNPQAWRQIITRAVMDSIGKKQVTANGEQKLVDDERSTAQGRNAARTFLRDTCIGRPTEYVNLSPDDSAYEQFAAYTDEQIAEILATIERLRCDSGDGGAAPQ